MLKTIKNSFAKLKYVTRKICIW